MDTRFYMYCEIPSNILAVITTFFDKGDDRNQQGPLLFSPTPGP